MDGVGIITQLVMRAAEVLLALLVLRIALAAALATAAALYASRGERRRAVRLRGLALRAAPLFARGLVAACVGGIVVTAPAAAAPSDVPLLDRVPSAAVETSAPAPTSTSGASIERVRVRPGDSLWSIAGRRLGPEATDAAIAREWPRWFAANRDVVGRDPSLLRPGQWLRAPQVRP